MVNITVPIYKEIPTENDLISLNQLFKILGHHKITFVHPENLNLKYYQHFKSSCKGFDEKYFKNISGYNSLMLHTDFYSSFSEKYLLIYQTDCFVFKDELLEWCKKEYDYIGAPWLGSSTKIPPLKLIFEKGISTTKTALNYKGNRKFQKDKSLLYNQVGNGGFSLRKREKCIEILKELSEVVKVYLKQKNLGTFYAEDVFFSIEPSRNNLEFTKPDYKEAAHFAIENKQTKAFEITKGELPFGCHRWDKERDFWREYFAKFGYKI